ncbi:MAG: hydroxymethylglutaryl-CoA lyase [Bdellovibrionales bacterium]|nr:hydroxymethylglutaryl-CoA lyase [Bdellovibrionales bacterium]
MSEIQILEVGLRDGFQNEKKQLSLEEKVFFAEQLAKTGLKRIELGSFVSAKWVPQMKDSKELVTHILNKQKQGLLDSQIQFSALVPNQRGLRDALETGIKEIAIFLSSTDSFSQKNINRSRDLAYQAYKELCKKALKEKLKIRAYLSVCFECPFEGKVKAEEVLKWVKKIKDLGVYEISISDTTGKARPQDVNNLLILLLKHIPKEKLACHFHNIHGMALSNAWVAYLRGIRVFDGSLGGLGGCPYSLVHSGNIATESLLYLFKGSQDPIIPKLLTLAKKLQKKFQKKLESPLLHSPYYK